MDRELNERRVLWAILHRYHPNGVEVTAAMMEILKTPGTALAIKTTHNPQRNTYILSAEE